jgi:hypothetical protein
MNRYQLAKLVEWAGGELRSRKRLQKVVYLLESAGVELGASFILHHYGPYSYDVAALSDEMVRTGLLEETPEQFPTVTQYSYSLPEKTKELIAHFEADESKNITVKNTAKFKNLAIRLLKEDLRKLELASTLAYFKKNGSDWDQAVDRACKFKNVDRESQQIADAEHLAKEIIEE